MKNVLAHLTLTSSAIVAAVAMSTGAVGAQSPPLSAGPTPSYATATNDQQIHGHISAVTGKYSLQVRDNRGYLDNVTLHQGTIINPTGLTLQPGMQVTISGTNQGAAFAANEIDTPYTVALVQPLYPAYPLYGSGFGYGPGWGWGPRFRGGFWW